MFSSNLDRKSWAWLNLLGQTPRRTINGVVWDGTSNITIPVAGGHVNELRLTLATGSPVTTADQTAKTTIFLTPYKGGNIDLFDGVSVWTIYNTAEVSVSVPATTTTPFDIWARNVAGTVTLDTTNWTNDTTRATALAYQNGVLVKSGDSTRRYLGTGRTTTVSGKTADSVANRFLWNYYNRVFRNGLGQFTADRSRSGGGFAELNTEIRCNFLIGVTEDAVTASVNGTLDASAGGTGAASAIAFDSTTVAETGFEAGHGPVATAGTSLAIAGNKVNLAVGMHFATLLGLSVDSSTTMVWNGTSSGVNRKVSLHVGLWA